MLYSFSFWNICIVGMKKYHTKNRCKYLLKLHLVFVVKYRKSILTGAIADDIKQFCMDVCKKNDVEVDMLLGENL